MGMGDRFFDVMDEMPRVREDLGYPPLVTPTSQIVGTMAMMNVMMGDRYKMVPNEVKDLVRGKYGALPGKISDEIRHTLSLVMKNLSLAVQQILSNLNWKVTVKI